MCVSFRENVPCSNSFSMFFNKIVIHLQKWQKPKTDYPTCTLEGSFLCKIGTSFVLALRFILCLGRTCYSRRLELANPLWYKGRSTEDRLRQAVDLVKRYLTSIIGEAVDPHKEKRAEKWKLLDRAGKHSAENTDQSRELCRVSSRTAHHSIRLLLCCHGLHPASALAPTNSQRAVDASVQRGEDGLSGVPLEKFSLYFLL